MKLFYLLFFICNFLYANDDKGITDARFDFIISGYYRKIGFSKIVDSSRSLQLNWPQILQKKSFLFCKRSKFNWAYPPKGNLATSIKILTIIPARCGSKSILDKNIKTFWGKPLLAWSIHHAKQSKYSEKMRIIVSTDSKEYAAIAKDYGAEVPFIRPKEISHDTAVDVQWAAHALQWLEENEGYIPDIVLQLRPTSPCRHVEDIDNSLDIFIDTRNSYESLRSVTRSDLFELKMYNIVDNRLKPLFKVFNNIWEPYNNGPRHLFPKNMVNYYTDAKKQSVRYMHNGYIDIFNPSIVKTGSISGELIYHFIMDSTNTIDIDTVEDWINAESYLELVYSERDSVDLETVQK